MSARGTPLANGKKNHEADFNVRKRHTFF